MKASESDSMRWEDIVFETRNKSYGAYVIRNKYGKNVAIATLIALGIIGFVLAYPSISEYFNKEEEIKENDLKSVKYTDLAPPPPIDKNVPPPPKLDVPPPVKTIIKFLPPKVTDKEVVEVDAVPPTFDEVVLPHLPAARRLARWLMRSTDDADDVVQESALRALLYFHTFTGGSARAWFLRIVRNTSFGWHRRHAPATADPFDEESHSHLLPAPTPESLLLQTDDASRVVRAMERLPRRARELLRLRELEGLTYRELAAALDIPLGTVMSGLARARVAFRDALANEVEP